MSRRREHILLALAVLLTWGVQPSWSAAPPAEMVRRDWYFRESLVAIRDWEAILAAREKAVPKAQRTPIFPVPTNGEAVEWPNPIPPVLRWGEDARVRVRMAGGKVEVTRVGSDGKEARRTSRPGATVVGCKHPGGGGRDRWYHRYHRRFDQLTTFQPRPAPFALQLAPPGGLRRGANELAVSVRNVTDKPLNLTMRLRFHTPPGRSSGADPAAAPAGNACGEDEMLIQLAAGAKREVRIPVSLNRQGGGLLVLTVGGAGGPFWLPILTHVEDVTSVLGGIEKILADTPAPPAAAKLAALRRRAAAWKADPPGRPSWRTLFEEAGALRDELLLRRVRFEAMLFLKRKPFNSEQPFMDAHHCYNRPGGSICRLSPVRPDGKVTAVVDSLGEGVYRDVCLHWDARRFLFAFGNGADRGRPAGKPPQSYNLYEARVDARRVRKLTSSPKNDCEPFYLPDAGGAGGQIGFTSDRSEYYVMCGSNIHAPTLFVMNADGSNVRQLSFNMFNDFNPTVLPDGRILYSRWEYNERSVTSLHNPFTINPDGTMMEVYYGNATARPNVVMFPRPVPGSTKIMALFTGHHGQTHGPIGLIDTERGLDGSGPLTILTPNVPITAHQAEDSRYGWFSDPVPLSETTYLCSFTPTVRPWLERSWAIYVGDRHGNLALVYRDPAISCAEPVPLVARPRPAVRPAAPRDTDAADAEATLVLLNTYVGLPGVPRGAAKYLRILEDVPRKAVPHGGVIVTSGTPIYTIKRIFGTVPVEPDGSAHFIVPANRNVYFEVLDADRLEIQRMRSVVCLKPGERRTCVGCHESRNTSPPNRRAMAVRRDPSRLIPPPWGTKTLSFLRDVQPMLNDKCVRCHTHDRLANRVILTDDLTDQFTIAYEELLGYIKVANAFRYDHPDDVRPRPPYTYGSTVSPLTKLLAKGHHDVKLSPADRQRLINWIDANGVYYDRYEAIHPKRQIFLGSLRKSIEDVYARRCASCHGKSDGRRGTWWMSLNRRSVKNSRALAAPLARSAGGWGRCDDPRSVFADTQDRDYRKLLAALTALRNGLARRPREDLLSIRGTAAERQKIMLPPPPPPRKPPKDLPKEGWVYLSDLRWLSAKAGWTTNGDGLPRRDRDVQDSRLVLGLRRYRKGIGTHAPSEIVYRLDAKFARFFAVVGGSEAKGTVVFQVFGDSQALFDSGVMHGLRGVKQIDVPVAGVRRLRLVVTDAGDSYSCDMATWADARLLRTKE